MATRKSPRDLNATDLVKQWKKIVNDKIIIGRDAHLFKEALLKYSPAQILLGIYQCKEAETLTIPLFLQNFESWIEKDEIWVEINLATQITKTYPKEYFIYLDFCDEESSYAWQQSSNAKKTLKEWADKVLA